MQGFTRLLECWCVGAGDNKVARCCSSSVVGVVVIGWYGCCGVSFGFGWLGCG